MNVDKRVNWDELARSTDEYNGAQLKVCRGRDGTELIRQAVCVEAGMIALREGASIISHEHYLSGVLEVASVRALSLCASLIIVRKRRTTTSVMLALRNALTLAVLLRGPNSGSLQRADTSRPSRSLAHPRCRPSLQSLPAALYFKPVNLSSLPCRQLGCIAVPRPV